MMRILALLPLACAAAACGARAELEPSPGQALPPAPQGASQPLTAEQLLEPRTIERPARVDELLRRSEQRQQDRFALPPGSVETPAAPDAPPPEARPRTPDP